MMTAFSFLGTKLLNGVKMLRTLFPLVPMSPLSPSVPLLPLQDNTLEQKLNRKTYRPIIRDVINLL